MPEHYGFLIDLGKYQFDETAPTWIQAFPLGTWQHPAYGEINVTPEKVARMADNVLKNVRGQELDIDYDHKERSGEAAGWVKGAEARSDGLWLAVQWTKSALTKLKDGAYKYFSPEYTDEWTNPSDQTKYQDVLFGGGITNRPFLKGILPINLTEFFEEATVELEETLGGKLDPKEVRKTLKLAEDASDEDVMAKLTELAAEPKPVIKADDKTDPVQVLAEADPVVKGLVEKIATLEAANRLSEVNLALKALDDGDGKFAIAPALIEQARTVALESPKSAGDKFIALLSEIRKGGIVELGERAGRSASQGDSGGETATKRFMDAATKASTENKIPLATAMANVAGQNPQLFDEYRNESYLRERGM